MKASMILWSVVRLVGNRTILPREPNFGDGVGLKAITEETMRRPAASTE
jgi:hypothetical protein